MDKIAQPKGTKRVTRSRALAAFGPVVASQSAGANCDLNDPSSRATRGLFTQAAPFEGAGRRNQRVKLPHDSER